LRERCFPVTATPVVASPAGALANDTPRLAAKRKPTRMFPPGSPPSALFTGSIWR
jgi:hypothetical protein